MWWAVSEAMNSLFHEIITSREAAVQKAADLTEMFRRLFENEKRSIHVTCSMGVALYPDDGRDFRTLYNYADRALYQAKSQGKDGYVVYDTANSRLPEETGYSSISAAIESQPISLGDSSDLLTYIFKLLCNMEDLEQAVNLSLEVVGKRFDVSRAYIFETNDVGKYYKNTYEWCNEGIEPEIQIFSAWIIIRPVIIGNYSGRILFITAGIPICCRLYRGNFLKIRESVLFFSMPYGIRKGLPAL